jgi:hypothetical protein
MRKKKMIRKSKNKAVEKDTVYVLKLILFFIVGCLWIRLGGANGTPIPIGLVFGILFASHDHFQIDKKIEFAILLVAAILSFIAPIGFVLDIQ